jgi:hypothetical protein
MKLEVQARFYAVANTVTSGTAISPTAWDSNNFKKEPCHDLISGTLFMLELNFEACEEGRYTTINLHRVIEKFPIHNITPSPQEGSKCFTKQFMHQHYRWAFFL